VSDTGQTGDARRAERLALNEALAREVNERVDDVASRWFDPDELVDFHCECVVAACTERISLTRTEYAEVRADPLTFVVRPQHEEPEVEEIVGRIRDFPVVRKTGRGAKVARSTDPRSPD
jgi:hypothetical protein